MGAECLELRAVLVSMHVLLHLIIKVELLGDAGGIEDLGPSVERVGVDLCSQRREIYTRTHARTHARARTHAHTRASAHMLGLGILSERRWTNRVMYGEACVVGWCCRVVLSGGEGGWCDRVVCDRVVRAGASERLGGGHDVDAWVRVRVRVTALTSGNTGEVLW